MIRLYRWLLRLLLPAELRDPFGDEISRDFERRLEGASSVAKRWRLALGGFADLARTALDLRVTRLRDAHPTLDAARTLAHQASRSLLRRPILTAGAATTLGLAIALALVAFSVLDGALLRALPYPAADRLVNVNGAARTPTDPIEWPARHPDIEAAAAFGLDRAVVTEPGGARDVRILAMGPTFQDLVGVPVSQGRRISDEEIADGSPVVMVSERLWRRLRGNVALDDTPIELDGRPFTVVGLVPDGFVVGRYEDRDVWRGLGFAEPAARGFPALVRLRTDAAVETVRAALESRLAEGGRVTAHPVDDALRGELRGPLTILLLAGLLVVGVATANLTVLTLARNVERTGEFAVRRAIGAGRRHLVGQMVVEGLVVATIGAGVGLLLASPLRDGLLVFAPGVLPEVFELGLGWRSVLFAIGCGVGATAVTGLIPSILVTGRRGPIGPGTRRHTRRGGRWITSMVIVETALVAALVVGSTLLVRTFLLLRPTDPGFAVTDRVVAELRLPERLYPDAASLRDFGLRTLALAPALEGRPEAALVTWLPLSGMSAYLFARTAESDPDANGVGVHHRAVSASYRELMRIDLRLGRGIEPSDDLGAPTVAVVNETAVRAFWPDDVDPLGRILTADVGHGETDFTVVGVVADARIFGSSTTARPELWTSFRQTPGRDFRWILAHEGGPVPGESEVRRAVAGLDPDVPVGSVETLEAVVGRSVRLPRFQLVLLGTLTGAGILLAAIGCFAVIAHHVRSLRRDLGIRLALGAAPAGVALRLIRRSVGLALAGGLLGALGTWLAGGWIGSRLFLVGIEPREPAPYLAALVVVALLGIAGAAGPARRGARVDPLTTLREGSG